ncbi:MAG: tRNA (adenosine(37)-N6)-threonylcarbamoyltransferase complex dimerization subunit type 1 TsaB, partial [Micrococcales bacterium]|nr:tRNA (adenosine(37)-N6)-threonylcarbamoyltransferase complex dimerization subunit type 1 TsaB [Micrococcales bacterium]
TEVVVGIGPGPFTGLRVGIVTGRTFAFALDLPVRGLCSLDAIAHEAWLAGARGGLLVATDARRREVYAAHFALDPAGPVRLAGPVVGKAQSLDRAWRDLPTAGRGGLLYPEALAHGVSQPSGIRPHDVSAGALADLAVRRLGSLAAGPGAVPPGGSRQHVHAGDGFDGLEPMYLRRPDTAPAVTSAKSVLG